MHKNINEHKIKKMRKQYVEWLEDAWPNRSNINITQAMIDKLKAIATHNGYTFIMKDELVLIFKSPDNELLFAWHYDADVNYSHFETGFDPSPNLEDLYEQDLLSEKAYRKCVLETIDLSPLPEKLRSAVKTYLKNPEAIDKNQYQNIYHNLYQADAENYQKIADRYLQKAKLTKFFNQIKFLKT
jgi:hypothetical protein